MSHRPVESALNSGQSADTMTRGRYRPQADISVGRIRFSCETIRTILPEYGTDDLQTTIMRNPPRDGEGKPCVLASFICVIVD